MNHSFRGRPASAGLRRFSFSASLASLLCLLGGPWLAPRLLSQTGDYSFATVAGIAGKAGSINGTGGGTNLPLFDGPIGLVVNSAGNLYVADTHNGLIRLVTPGGVVTTFVGTPGLTGGVDGTGADTGVSFNLPQGPAVDKAGNLYVADYRGATIRKITPAGVVTTLAGTTASTGSTDATGVAARFLTPAGVAADSAGNIYVADTGNHTIRKITSAGVVTTFAGTIGTAGGSDGTGTAALFNMPRSVVTDSSDNIYVADAGNRCIRKITPAGVVTTVAGGTANFPGGDDGTGRDARFFFPVGLTIDGSGNLYVADSGNNTIRKITPSMVVTTLAGSASATAGLLNGTGAAARFKSPTGVAADSAGNVYVADFGNSLIRKITPAGVVTTIAGAGAVDGMLDGEGFILKPSLLNNPSGAATDAAGNVYVADTGNNLIRKITPAGVVTALAGSATASGHLDGIGGVATFNAPVSVTADAAGNVYVADTANHLVRKVTPTGVVTTLAGTAGVSGNTNAAGTGASFDYPTGVAADAAGNVFVADYNGHTIRRIAADGTVTTLAGATGHAGSADGQGTAASFNHPRGVAVDGAGNVYVADFGNRTIRKISAGGMVQTLAGSAGATGSADGTGSAARFDGPSSVAVNGAGYVFATDSNNNAIRMISPTGVVTTVGGAPGSVGNRDGTGTAARFNHPTGVAVDASGNLLIADSQNHIIRKGWAPGSAGTGSGGPGSGSGGTAGDGSDASYTNGAGGTSDTSSGSNGAGGASGITVGTGFFLHPSGMVIDSSSNYFVTDTANNCIKKIDTTLGVSVFAGLEGSAGTTDGTGTAARFNGPTGIAIDASNNLYVCDTGNGTIRMITSAGVVTTFAGNAANRGAVDGTGSAASFASPTGIVYDTTTSTLYVTDAINCTVRAINSLAFVTTFAGATKTAGDADGAATAARFNNPEGIAIDASQNLYVADTYNHIIRKITTVETTNAVLDSANVVTVTKVPAGTVTTLAGASGVSGTYDGTAVFALFNQPTALCVDANKNVYVADSGNSSIRCITAKGVVTTIAGIAGISGGRDGAGAQALFNQPQGLLHSTSLMVSDTGNSLIRSVLLSDYSVSTPVLVTAATTTTTTTTTPTPTGSGGGGSPSLWFCAALSLLGIGRGIRRRIA